jgi:hypothetical protein
MLEPETQIWWSELVREYATLRAADPAGDPRAVVDDVVRSWSRDRRTPER